MTIKESLEHSGMENVVEKPYWWVFEFNDNKIVLTKNNNSATWSFTFSLNINGKQIATRCNFRTALQRIKSYR